ncbi:MAG TPA: hypothetical protein VN614_04825 [Rhodanobacter sp.]|nr:hypothetical protein [Rhodanobacter sp.]
MAAAIPHVSRKSWRQRARWLVFGALMGTTGLALAWSDHTLGTWQALAVMPAIVQAPPVTVESLDSFLAAEDSGLAQLLAQEEAWDRTHVPAYPPRPEALQFQAGGPAATRRQRFMAALRINPNCKLALFLQMRPGTAPPTGSELPWTDVTTLQHDDTVRNSHFERLHAGEQVPVLEVIATASGEPDEGLDIGLWEDNGTPYGKTYGFGKQPFGDPALEFGSQAPFHMGFYHESPIIYKAAGFLQRTYPEYRIHLYRSLAVFALKTGHPYWGWRFAGWALHYVQDLTQPYHATVLPDVSTARMLWINALDIAGWHGPKDRAIRLVSNRHLALENYQYHRMRTAYLHNDPNDAVLRAVRDTSEDAAQALWADTAPRQVVSRQAHAWADRTDRMLVQALPTKYVSDPAYVFEQTEPDINLFAVLNGAPQKMQDEMTQLLSTLMQHFGTQTRVFIGSLTTP